MTNTDLPAGYEDWEEVAYPEVAYPHVRPIGPRYLKVEREEIVMNQHGRDEVVHYSTTRYFVPPKLKPTLPDVKPGAVIGYTNKSGRTCRAVNRSGGIWDTYFQTSKPLNLACTTFCVSDAELMEDVNADGFTVELEGL